MRSCKEESERTDGRGELLLWLGAPYLGTSHGSATPGPATRAYDGNVRLHVLGNLKGGGLNLNMNMGDGWGGGGGEHYSRVQYKYGYGVQYSTQKSDLDLAYKYTIMWSGNGRGSGSRKSCAVHTLTHTHTERERESGTMDTASIAQTETSVKTGNRKDHKK